MRIQNKLAITFLSSVARCGIAARRQSRAPTLAGRGGSPQAIKSAIDANSVDSIQAELERAEHLVCSSCTDMVLPLVDHLNYRVRQAAALVARAPRGPAVRSMSQMLNRLSQPDSVLALNAADVIGEFRAAPAIPAFSAARSRTPLFTGEARAAMAHALGQIGRNDVAAPLTQALGDADPVVKAASLQALREVDCFHDGMVAAPLAWKRRRRHRARRGRDDQRHDAPAGRGERARQGADLRSGRARAQEGRLVPGRHRRARERRGARPPDGRHERLEPLRPLPRPGRDFQADSVVETR